MICRSLIDIQSLYLSTPAFTALRANCNLMDLLPRALDRSDPQASSGGAVSLKRKRTRCPVACDACKKRKSRCEVDSPAGCHRCRILGTPCNATGEQVQVLVPKSNTTEEARPKSRSRIIGSETDASGDDEDNMSATSSAAPKDERSLLRRINQRTRDIQRLLRCLVTERHQHPLHSLSLAEQKILEDGVGDGDDVEANVARLLGTTIGSSLLVVSGLNLHDRTVFIDPVAGGCISAAKMDQVTSQ
jgi:hypothetical protein